MIVVVSKSYALNGSLELILDSGSNHFITKMVPGSYILHCTVLHK